MTIIFFQWADASMMGVGQYSLNETKDEGLIQGCVCGHLVEEREDCYVVALDYFPKDKQYRNVNIYPKSGIDVKSIIIKEIVPEVAPVSPPKEQEETAMNCWKCQKTPSKGEVMTPRDDEEGRVWYCEKCTLELLDPITYHPEVPRERIEELEGYEKSFEELLGYLANIADLTDVEVLKSFVKILYDQMQLTTKAVNKLIDKQDGR